MPHLTSGLALLLCSLCAIGGAPGVGSAQEARRKGSPFDGLRWVAKKPEVRVGDTWYELRSIHGVASGKVLAFCKKRWPGKVRKRFGEDLTEAMALMGHLLPAQVDLELTRLDNRQLVTRKGVAVTHAKREAIRRGPGAAKPARARRLAPKTLSRAAARADLESLRARLRDQFAYLHLGGVPWEEEWEKVVAALPDPVPTAWLATSVRRLMARFRDGHAQVASASLPRPAAYPPFLLQDARGGVVALRADRGGFVDPKHPFVTAIDGVALDVWVQRAAETVVAGSPQLVRRRALRGLREIDLLRSTRRGQPLRLRLTGAQGKPAAEREVALVRRPPVFGSWPRRKTGTLPGNIGYLRIPRMDERVVPQIRAAMTEFRATAGLIVDVRGNGGGTREPLLALAGYLRGDDEKPWVGNAGRYIRSARFPKDHLEGRFMYREGDRRWTQAQREAIASFRKSFRPEWTPPGEFSDWHYLVLDRQGGPAEYFYAAPVIVLSDSWCFSATDIFLGALYGRPRITLMGEASSGGSARSAGFSLPQSRIRVSCASMVSYRPDGRLYDGRGVEVDVRAVCEATDLLRNGTDTVLEAARRRLIGAK